MEITLAQLRSSIPLFLMVSFSIVLIPNDAASEDIGTAAFEAYESGDHQTCVELMQEYATVVDANPLVLYAGACCGALLEDRGIAFDLLRAALEHGFSVCEILDTDPDLANLKDDPRWDSLVAICYAGREASLNPELKQIYEDDQFDRDLIGDCLQNGDSIPSREIAVRDSLRRLRVGQIIVSGELNEPSDYFHAAMIFQHGEQPTDYLLAYMLTMKAVDLRMQTQAASWLAAAATDRYLWSIGKPQWFGTQRQLVDGIWTIEPIDTLAVTDEQREEWGVPSLHENREKAQEMNDDGNRGE